MHTVQNVNGNMVNRKSCFISTLFSPFPFLWQLLDTSKSLEYFGWLTVGMYAVSTNFGYSVSTLFLEQEREKVLRAAQDGEC